MLPLEEGRLDVGLEGAIFSSECLEDDLERMVSGDSLVVDSSPYPLLDIAVSAADLRRVGRFGAGLGTGCGGEVEVFCLLDRRRGVSSDVSVESTVDGLASVCRFAFRFRDERVGGSTGGSMSSCCSLAAERVTLDDMSARTWKKE